MQSAERCIHIPCGTAARPDKVPLTKNNSPQALVPAKRIGKPRLKLGLKHSNTAAGIGTAPHVPRIGGDQVEFSLWIHNAKSFAARAAERYFAADNCSSPHEAARLRVIGQEAQKQAQQLCDKIWADAEVKPMPVSVEIDRLMKKLRAGEPLYENNRTPLPR